MPGARLPMRNVRDVLRLTAAGMSSRKIAASRSIGATTVIDCLHRARRAGLRWPLPDRLDDVVLEVRLFRRGRHEATTPAPQLGDRSSRAQAARSGDAAKAPQFGGFVNVLFRSWH